MLLLSEVLRDVFSLFLCFAIFFGFAEASLRHACAMLIDKDDGLLVDDGYGDYGDGGHGAPREADSGLDDSDVHLQPR